MRKVFILLVLFISFSNGVSAGETQRFPLSAKKLREKGIALPLPFGVSALFSHVRDDTEISKVSLPSFGEIRGVKFLESTSETEAFYLRADLWVLPFMNLYLIGGYLDGRSATKVDASELFFTPGFVFDIEEDYHGTSLGAGTTLVYGVKNIWVASLDINYVETELNVVDGDIKSFSVTPRISYLMQRHGLPLVLGIGVCYLDIEQTLTARIPRQNGGPDILAEVDIKNKKNWNALMTAGYEINKHWQLFTEIGFYDRRSFFTQLCYRF